MIGASRKCGRSLSRVPVRLLATGSGDGKGSKGKDFPIDFNALFKSVGEKKEGAPARPEPIDFKKLFSSPASGDKSSRKEVDNEKLKLDLSKLFGDASASTGKPGSGGLKGFKLDLSKLRGRSDVKSSTGLEDAARREATAQKLGVLSKISKSFTGVAPLPPKDDLVERYFALENMSLAERRKLELTKVMEEFRLHESDCGSSPVQIAMLTKKIKFLSQHFTQFKKDLHSRRGLNGMIQRRRKHLIYLRRTNWDMYCHVIARLGLKDNLEVPDAARKTTATKSGKHKKRRKSKKKPRARV